MYKHDLVLNNPKWLICYKNNQPTIFIIITNSFTQLLLIFITK